MRTAENRLKAAWKLNGEAQESRQPKKPKPVARVLRWVKAKRKVIAIVVCIELQTAGAAWLGYWAGQKRVPDVTQSKFHQQEVQKQVERLNHARLQ